MENETKPNDGAFAAGDGDLYYWQSGLTKREYFAAMAMQGILAAYSLSTTIIDHEYNSRHSVKAADALIEALNKSLNP